MLHQSWWSMEHLIDQITYPKHWQVVSSLHTHSVHSALGVDLVEEDKGLISMNEVLLSIDDFIQGTHALGAFQELRSDAMREAK